MLSFASATTSVPDSVKAAEDISRKLRAAGASPAPRVIVFHVAVGHELDTLVARLREEWPDTRLVGCTCAGVIGATGADESMRALAAMAIDGPSSEVAVVWRDDVDGASSRERGRELAREVREQLPAVNMVMALAPGIDVAADALIAGIEDVLGPELTVFGGTSADNMKALMNRQVVDAGLYSRAAFVVGFADPTLTVETQASHGFVPAGLEVEVTRASGNRIHELDGEPAWGVFTRSLGLDETATFGDTIPPGALGEALSPALAGEYGDSHILRVITRKDADGTIYMPVTCEVGTRLSFMRRDEERIFWNLDVMMTELRARIGPGRPVAVFHTDCGARGRLTLGRVAKEEIVERMQTPLFGASCGPWLGMYGFGELTRLGGRNTFHNYTTSLYVISRRGA